MRYLKHLWPSFLLLLAPHLTPCSLAQAQEAPRIDSESFESWLAFIRPTERELLFEKIGWRSEFWPAVQEAKRLGRPILLWTMNGHPLGCT